MGHRSLRGLFVLVFIVNKIGPFGMAFHKLGLIVSSPSFNTRNSSSHHLISALGDNKLKTLGLRPCAFISFLEFGYPDKTLAPFMKYLDGGEVDFSQSNAWIR